MGVELKVDLPPGHRVDWPVVAAHLATAGLAVQMRMINGELAFPDETPPDDWHELRLACGGDMITVRRASAQITVVGWGNLNEAGQHFMRAVADAFAVGKR